MSSASGYHSVTPLREPSNRSSRTIDSSPTVVQSPVSPRTPKRAKTPVSPGHHRLGYRSIAAENEANPAHRGPQTAVGDAQSPSLALGRGVINLQSILTTMEAPTSRAKHSPHAGRRIKAPATLVDSPFSPSRLPVTPRNSAEEILRPMGMDTPDGQSVSSPPNRSLPKHFPADDIKTENLHSRDNFHCKSKGNLFHHRTSWPCFTILVLSVYSTSLSGVWLCVAFLKPRYGHRISTNGSLTPATASILVTVTAKSIELSFVTVFVAFIGQVLSRRAMITRGKGVTIAEMSMKSWIMQPGLMLTDWGTLGHSALSVLGILTLTGTFITILYTTASDVLVAPKLKFGGTEYRVLYGKVATVFANEGYMEQNCKTPISTKVDPIYSGSTCIAIEHSGQVFHNFMLYLGQWYENIAQGNGSYDLGKRPQPVGTFYDNTTVQGSWLHSEERNTTRLFLKLSTQKRIVNNVTVAMPHVGVLSAARDSSNNILQPQDLNGIGEYHIRASVPSPTTNVLCATMEEEELTPMIYSKWPRSDSSALNLTDWPNGFNIPPYPDWLNKTPVDDLFEFGERYGRRHPVFPKLPVPYNTIVNGSGAFIDTLYILATSPDSTYMLCAMRTSLTPNCSTEYHASKSGGFLNTRCGRADSDLAYGTSATEATEGVVNRDWTSVAGQWALATGLNAGITDGRASNARILTQLIPTTQPLDASWPSIAEALAVLSSSTLLLSSVDAPFIHFWNYSSTVVSLIEPQYEGFNATIRTQDYSSGWISSWQNTFFLVLFIMFILNLLCLAYLLPKRMITDFMEPQNMFSLSLNSKASKAIEGACGAGPQREQFDIGWFIKCDTDREHFYIESGASPVRKRRGNVKPTDVESDESPTVRMYKDLSNPKTWRELLRIGTRPSRDKKGRSSFQTSKSRAAQAK